MDVTGIRGKERTENDENFPCAMTGSMTIEIRVSVARQCDQFRENKLTKEHPEPSRAHFASLGGPWDPESLRIVWRLCALSGYRSYHLS